MKNTMTYAQALNFAIDTISDEIVKDRLTTLRDTLAKRSQRSEDSKAKANAKRKMKNAENRAAMLAQVLPILSDNMPTSSGTAMTAKEIFAACEASLPDGFTSAKVQYILLNDMPEIRRVENKGKANAYFREV